MHISPCRQYFLSIVQSFFAAFGTYKFLCSFYSSTTPPPPLSMNAAGPSEKCSKLLYYRHILKRNPKVPKPLFLLANSILISFQKHCELKVQAFSENPVVGALLVVKLLQQLFRSLREHFRLRSFGHIKPAVAKRKSLEKWTLCCSKIPTFSHFPPFCI